MSPRMRLARRSVLGGSLAFCAAPALFARTPDVRRGGSINERMGGDIAPVHDPCIIRQGGLYHIFSTGRIEGMEGHVPWRTSSDLVHWKLRGTAMPEVPDWASGLVPGAQTIWAPDISYFNGRYHLYYSVSTFGSNRSVIGLATNATLEPGSPDNEWRDEGLVIASRAGDDFNAIDANHAEDAEGNHWLVLGSFWSGIKLFRLDGRSGKLHPDDGTKHSLASRPVPETAPGAIEAPFIIRRGDWFYLFVSFDYCCRGKASNYYIVAGRSRSITGPYAGRDGRLMTNGYGTVVLQGNQRYRGPGHPAVLHDAGRDYLVYHAYDAMNDGVGTLRIAPLTYTADGWPTARH